MIPTCFSCRYWGNGNNHDKKGVFRMGRCINPNRLISAEEGEKIANPPCWEAQT